MGRNKTKTENPEFKVTDADTPGLPAMVAAANQLAARSAAISKQYGDGLPYDRERVVNECRFYMGEAAEAMLEAGKRLIQLKENEPHGEFMRVVEGRLGLSYFTANKMIKAAVKFSSPQLSKLSAPTTLGKTKLLELMVEDDEDLAALAAGGTVAGLTLDDMDRMTSRELRKALRDAREDAGAKDRLLAEKNQKIDGLATKLRQEERKDHITQRWNDMVREINHEISAIAHGAEEALSQLIGLQGAIIEGDFNDGKREAARAALVRHYADRAQRLIELAAELQHSFTQGDLARFLDQPRYIPHTEE